MPSRRIVQTDETHHVGPLSLVDKIRPKRGVDQSPAHYGGQSSAVHVPARADPVEESSAVVPRGATSPSLTAANNHPQSHRYTIGRGMGGIGGAGGAGLFRGGDGGDGVGVVVNVPAAALTPDVLKFVLAIFDASGKGGGGIGGEGGTGRIGGNGGRGLGQVFNIE
ncbi:hypothetical protein MSAN_00564800 [Mycena sanguinolenta]|uniref:Uncharacterized protein n=1 Tax=Mycena sanguinolenta TaxID=230812 RepID=A0A8H6Z9P7_9AGAR|nr:hypothetical protein MSAN_00564800 [Mycena sanguinolenta]